MMRMEELKNEKIAEGNKGKDWFNSLIGKKKNISVINKKVE